MRSRQSAMTTRIKKAKGPAHYFIPSRKFICRFPIKWVTHYIIIPIMPLPEIGTAPIAAKSLQRSEASEKVVVCNPVTVEIYLNSIWSGLFCTTVLSGYYLVWKSHHSRRLQLAWHINGNCQYFVSLTKRIMQ